MSDDALVAQAQHDRHAFGLLYDRYVELIFRYCLVRLRDREDAEDATSLVFARALAALPTQRGSSFRSWLFSIAHNVVVDAQRGASPGLPLGMLELLPATGPSLEEQAVAEEQHRIVVQLLASLPNDQRHVLELRLAGLTGPEVAVAIGRSHDSVRTTQRRALSRLRTLIGITLEREERYGAS